MATESVVITAHFGSSAQVKMSKCQKYHFCMSPKMTVKRIATDAQLFNGEQLCCPTRID